MNKRQRTSLNSGIKKFRTQDVCDITTSDAPTSSPQSDLQDKQKKGKGTNTQKKQSALTLVMDDVKLKSEVDPFAAPENVTNVEESFPTHGNLLSQNLKEEQVESEDPTDDLDAVVKSETSSAYFSFVSVKCEPEKELCDLNMVKEDLLDVTVEDDGFPSRSTEQDYYDDVRNRECADLNIPAQHSGNPGSASDTQYKCKMCGKGFNRLTASPEF
ncbi:uncharacterized protein [Periplaneta americana]|uniref:uncharacterized protein n=1 Tax=Periplaneta americana TaxID=6978 RepID=UPI0037E98474